MLEKGITVGKILVHLSVSFLIILVDMVLVPLTFQGLSGLQRAITKKRRDVVILKKGKIR